jgi:integrase
VPRFGAETPLRRVVGDTFSIDDIERFRRDLLAREDLSTRTALFKLAKRRKMIDANPCVDAERISVKASDDFNILSPIDLVRACTGPREVAVVSVAFYAGLRLGEIRELRWRDVDWAKRMIYVRANASAGQRSRTKKPIVFHDLRHSYCSWAVDVWPVPDVKAFAGHRDISTTMKSVHRTAKAMHATMAPPRWGRSEAAASAGDFLTDRRLGPGGRRFKSCLPDRRKRRKGERLLAFGVVDVGATCDHKRPEPLRFRAGPGGRRLQWRRPWVADHLDTQPRRDRAARS